MVSSFTDRFHKPQATREWAYRDWRDSGIPENMIEANLKILSGDSPYDYLCYSKDLKRTNPGRLTAATLRRYSHTSAGGWWVSGLDPLNDWEPMTWGCFKPIAPRKDPDSGKVIKYEHPPKTPARAFFLRGTRTGWKACGARYGVEVPDLWEIPHTEVGAEFWRWIEAHPAIPVVICEGAKKAACLLALGYAAIALPGVSSGFRKEPGTDELAPRRNLIPDLEWIAAQCREVYICFDRDIKRSTQKNVNTALALTGKLFLSADCSVRVVSLPAYGNGKTGVDDFVMAHGGDAFEALYQSAPTLQHWEAKQAYQLSYAPSVRVCDRYLQNVPYPKSGLACIKAPKGTGKTEALAPFIQGEVAQGRRALVVTHRIQLGRAITSRLGLDWVEDISESETRGQLGYGLCVDSLHPDSAARFNPANWEGFVIILDECEQIIWHLLNSSTCYEKRVKILTNLRELLNTVAQSGGLIIAQDADLSDLTIDFINGLLEHPLEPWVFINDWKPSQGWDTKIYAQTNPAALMVEMERAIATLQPGKKLWIQADSQKCKSKWGTQNLERRINEKFPGLRTLRIDSESVGEPGHPAFNCTASLNEIIASERSPDIIIASPSIGTGVSVDARGVFVGLFAFFQGSCSEPESRQALSRVRDESCPRYIWARSTGVGRVGNGSSSYRAVATSKQKIAAHNLRRLQDFDFDLDSANDPHVLRCWAKIAARINAGMANYRDELAEALREEGHRVSLVLSPEEEIESLKNQLTVSINGAEEILARIAELEAQVGRWDAATADANQSQKQIKDFSETEEAIAIEESEPLMESEALALESKRQLSKEERLRLRKWHLEQIYAVPADANLALADNQRWSAKLRLHYYLAYQREIRWTPAGTRELFYRCQMLEVAIACDAIANAFTTEELLAARERAHIEQHAERGEGQVCLHDLRFFQGRIDALRALGIEELLRPGAEFTKDSVSVCRVTARALKYRSEVKDFLGLNISEKMSPIQICQSLLALLDLKLTCKGQRRKQEERERVYQFRPPCDRRWEIFAAWSDRELAGTLAKIASSDTPPVIQEL